MGIAITAVFAIGYLAIAAERFLRVNKSAIALLTGVVCWTLVALSIDHKHGVSGPLIGQLGGFAGILFFLMGAMVVVELIDLHQGFAVITRLLSVRSKRSLLWIVAFTAFFLSSVLDNLTTTIVMISLLSKLIADRDERVLFVSMIVIAANAGGAWTPIGDITTTMLWIGGEITSGAIIKTLVVPSMVCLAVPLVFASRHLHGQIAVPGAGPAPHGPANRREALERRLVLGLGLGVLVCVPLFKGLTHLPPFMGMLLGVALLSIVVEWLHRTKSPAAHEAPPSIARALERIDLQSVLFFLGILLCVASLDSAGQLYGLAAWLDRHIAHPNLVVLLMGLLSAVVDNVPLVAATMRMYDLSRYGVNHHFWLFLSYCVGTGGSILIVGSAAGVAAMGMAKIEFFWYVKRITPLALIGYAAGAGTYLLIEALTR